MPQWVSWGWDMPDDRNEPWLTPEWARLAHPLVRLDHPEHPIDQWLPYLGRMVDKLVAVPLAEHQKAGIVAWTSERGPLRLRRSLFLMLVNEGRFEDAADDMVKWCLRNGVEDIGLKARRLQEQGLFKGNGCVR